jgi:hypothetical protein
VFALPVPADRRRAELGMGGRSKRAARDQPGTHLIHDGGRGRPGRPSPPRLGARPERSAGYGSVAVAAAAPAGSPRFAARTSSSSPVRAS